MTGILWKFREKCARFFAECYNGIMLYVLRHGQVDMNARGLVNGWNGDGLNKTGLAQAQTAGKELQQVDFRKVLCSPLARSRQTLQQLGIQDTPVIYEPRLIERNAGTLLYAPATKLDQKLWYDPSKRRIYDDTEGFQSVIGRAKSLIDELWRENQGQNILLVTHEDVCRAIHLLFHPETEDISQVRQGNCEIATYEL